MATIDKLQHGGLLRFLGCFVTLNIIMSPMEILYIRLSMLCVKLDIILSPMEILYIYNCQGELSVLNQALLKFHTFYKYHHN